MSTVDLLLRAAHLVAVLMAVLVIALIGRSVAGKVCQPAVVGELTAGLLAGPAVISLIGRDTFATLVPTDILAALKLISEAGLVLFLVGLTHKLRVGSAAPARGAVGWIVVGALLPALLAGVLLALWVLLTGDPHVRGTAPAAALVLMLAVTLSVTAVPVLARILTDRGMSDTTVGHLALASAIVIDAISWLLLALAIGLAAGGFERFLRSMAALACGAVAAVLLRMVLHRRAAEHMCQRVPWFAALLISGVAVAMALAMERLGMTAIVGAVLAGLAVPATERWSLILLSVTRIGRTLVPVFLVVTGVTVSTAGVGGASIALIGLATFLGTAGKTVGGYLGARCGGQSHWDSMRLGSLINTRGLTELVVLQAGYSVGVLTTPLYLALAVMALVTTAITGPTLLLIDYAELRHRAPRPRLTSEPPTQGSAIRPDQVT